MCKGGRTAQPPSQPDGGNRKTVRGNRRAGNRIIAMTDEPHTAAETEPAGKLPTIVAVHATGPISLRITWSAGIQGQLQLTTVLAARRFDALSHTPAFTRAGARAARLSPPYPSGLPPASAETRPAR